MRRKILLVMALIGVFLLVVGCGEQEETKVEEKAVPVKVTQVSKIDLDKEIEMTGQVEAGTEVSIAPKVQMPARVKAIHIQVGQSVNKGSVLLELDDTDANNSLRNAQAAIELIEIQLETAQKNYDRHKQLFEANVVSDVVFEQAETTLKTTQASHKQAQVALNIAQNTLNELKILAPIGGKIAALNTEVGEMVSAQNVVAEIINLNKVLVKLNLSENVVSNVNVGQKVDIVITSINKTVAGTVKSIAPRVDSRTKAYPVEVQIPNEDNKILAGMVAKLKLSTGKVTNAIVVPVAAVTDDNGIHKLFVVENGVAKERIVKVGVKSVDQIQIIEGLKEKEQVVVAGNKLIGDGQKVEVVKSQSTDKPGVK